MCILWRSQPAMRVARDAEVRVGPDPVHARSVGVLSIGVTAYVQERAGASVAIGFHDGLDPPAGMEFWASAADLVDAPL